MRVSSRHPSNPPRWRSRRTHAGDPAVTAGARGIERHRPQHLTRRNASRVELRFPQAYGEERYNWERDYPRDLQAKKPDGETVVRLTFALNRQDEDRLQEATGHRVSDLLPVELSFGVGVDPLALTP